MSEPEMKNRTSLILYGSETGNAQDVAEDLGRIAQRMHFSTMVTSLDSIELPSLSKYSLVCIAISTTGQGDLPANSKLLWKKLLRKKLPTDYLAGVRFALFGLGDSSYPKFNWAALKLFKRLVQLGADPIVPKGEGDEQHPEGIDSIYIPWGTELRRRILELYPLAEGIEPISETELLPPQWLLAHGDDSISGFEKIQASSTGLGNGTAANEFDVILEANERVTASGHWQDVRHLKFCADKHVNYVPGDILTIYPENPQEDVDSILKVLGWEPMADHTLYFKPNEDFKGTMTAPKPMLFSTKSDVTMTLRTLLKNHLDLNAIPRRSFFSTVLHFTSDEFQKNRLQEFTDPEYTDELFDYTTRPRRSILEVLQEFDTLEIPWQWAATILPPLRGRQFSIASGGKLRMTSDSKSSFELLVAIVKYKTVIRKIRRGTCTRYLEGLPVGSKLRVTLVQGSLGISNKDLQKPIVMIGPGTGVAPMRSLIWERLCWYNEVRSNRTGDHETASMGQNLLVFGCRNRSSDYFFEHEWQTLLDKMPLTVLPAFSRDGNTKVYVQDIIRQHKEDIVRLIVEDQGIVYVCGSSGKMPQAVREALIDAFQLGGRFDHDGAEAYLQAMEKQGRYKQETW